RTGSSSSTVSAADAPSTEPVRSSTRIPPPARTPCCTPTGGSWRSAPEPSPCPHRTAPERTGAPSVSSEIVVVPHTHWEREWYEPHDVFRLRLVHMLDRLLVLLEEEPAYRFTLDGQAAAIEDYLEMRPENRDRVGALVE